MDSPPPDAASAPRRLLRSADVIAITVGIVIGAGIYKTPSMVAGVTGDVGWAMVAWGLGAVVALAGALCYAELATAYPHAGGDYYFLTRAFGRHTSDWIGRTIELYVDPTVRNPSGQKVGGIRIRIPDDDGGPVDFTSDLVGADAAEPVDPVKVPVCGQPTCAGPGMTAWSRTRTTIWSRHHDYTHLFTTQRVAAQCAAGAACVSRGRL